MDYPFVIGNHRASDAENPEKLEEGNEKRTYPNEGVQ